MIIDIIKTISVPTPFLSHSCVGITYDETFFSALKKKEQALPPSFRPLLNGTILGMHPKRQASFLAGRVCGFMALSSLMSEESLIGQGPKGEPLWPLGVQGSITHKAGEAFATVTKTPYLYLGIDTEVLITDSSKLNALKKRVCLFAEEKQILQSALDPSLFLTVCFAVKECFYKALFPVVQQFFGFDALCVEQFDPKGHVIAKWGSKSLGFGTKEDRFFFRFEVKSQRVYVSFEWEMKDQMRFPVVK